MTDLGAPSLNVVLQALCGAADVSPRDDAAVRQAAERHGMGGILHEAAIAAGASALTHALHDDVVAAVARESLAGPELIRVLDGFARAGVDVILVKGAALAYAVYAAPWQRPRIDTDLLIDASQRDAAGAVLGALGYTRSDALTSGTLVSSQCAFERPDASGVRHLIDLHWQAVNPQLFADALPFAELWRDRLPLPTLGPAAWMPNAVNALQLAAVHRLAHHQGNDRLVWLYDVHLLASGLRKRDWQRLTGTAVERQIAAICRDALHAAARAFRTVVPSDSLAALERAARHEPSFHYVQGPVRRRHVLMNDLARLSWRARLTLLREHAFPPAAFMRSRYHVRSSVWLPALYVHRLLTGAYRWIRA
jgi:hypothetical protein